MAQPSDIQVNVRANVEADTPVRQASLSLTNNISDLDLAIARLIELINPILGPNNAPTREEDPRDSRERSEMASFLDHQADKVGDLIRHIQNLNERVEL